MQNRPFYRSYRVRAQLKPLGFAAALASLFCLSLMIAYMSAGPIVLGTEMNTNGQVEYLCLGNGCNGLY